MEGDPRENSDDTRRDRDREASPRGRRGVGADGSALRRVRRSQLFVVLGRVLHHRAALASKWRAARRPLPVARGVMSRGRVKSSLDDPDVLCCDADRAHELGEHDRAVRLYHRALRTLKPPHAAPPSTRVSRVYERVASCERAMGRTKDAIDALERSVRWDDGYADAWMALGEVCLDTRRIERAVEAFEAFCERCHKNELERGRTMLRLTRSIASGEGMGRDGEGQPHRQEEVPEERNEVRRDEPSNDGVDFYTILDDARRALFGSILRTSRFVTANMLSHLRRVGRLHELPRSIERDSKIMLGCALFAIAFTQSTCARTSSRRGSSSVCESLCQEFHIPYVFRTEMCEMWDHGYWFPVVIVATNLFTYKPMRNSDWSVGPRPGVSRHRLILYQFAHASESHLIGNMLTLLAISVEASQALGCDQILFALLYLCSGWCGGLCAAIMGVTNSRHVGASGSISGAILALSVLRPHQAVHILGDVKAAQPWLLLLGTLAADLLSNRSVSWEGHLGGGLAGAIFARIYRLSRSS